MVEQKLKGYFIKKGRPGEFSWWQCSTVPREQPTDIMITDSRAAVWIVPPPLAGYSSQANSKRKRRKMFENEWYTCFVGYEKIFLTLREAKFIANLNNDLMAIIVKDLWDN